MDDPLRGLGKVLQEHGYRLTAARRLVLASLQTCGGHISADDLVLLINQKGASIGRMTVYRTLDLLSELGLVRPVYQGTGAAHYVLLQNGHHHHLICISCDRVIEIDRCLLPEIEHGIAEYLSFEIRGHLLEVYGQCDQCQKGTRSLV